MKTIRFAAPALSAATLLVAATVSAQQYPQQQQQQQQPGYGNQGGYQNPGGPPPQYGGPPQGPGGWDAPPSEYNDDIHRRGFRDGISAARSDFEQHRQPNSQYRPEFRHPPVPRPARNDYRSGFQRGYDVATRHMMERHDDHRDGPPGQYPR